MPKLLPIFNPKEELMTDKIRWGLLSTANINKALIDPIRQAQRSELVAVASRDPAKAKTYAEQNGIPQAYGSYEALLADPNIDAIYNPLPNTLHSEWTIKAANAGKHVLCEKPLVTTMAEFDQVAAAAQRNNVTVFEAFMYLHHPQTRTVQALIAAGELGEIQQINGWFHFYLPSERATNIRLSATLDGGSLWDVGVYPNSVAIVMAQAAGAGEAPETVWANKIVGDGLVAQISSGLRTPFREAVHIIGNKGAIHLVEPWKPGVTGKESRCLITTIDGGEKVITTPAINPYLCEVEAMEQCILDGAAPVVPLSLSRNFLRSALAIHASAQMGQPVAL
jgi:D-xylose 1-dehydrogenase (NADP+, D-xylono-1,5-lactone-forming)